MIKNSPVVGIEQNEMLSIGNTLEHVPCPVGCGAGDDFCLIGHDLLHDLPGSFTVVKCKKCGLMRTCPRPSPQSMGAYYPKNYGPYLGTRIVDPTDRVRSKSRMFFSALVKRIFSFNTQVLPKIKPGQMLEVGCASGSFLHLMSGQGWDVQGIEFDSKAAKTAGELGYQVQVGALEKVELPDEYFDLIVGWMVLEHLHDPVNCLNRLRKSAKPGAWLVLSIPNAGSLEFRIFKDKWYALQLPTHLFHFTTPTITTVLESGGWKLVKVHHQRILSNAIASAGYFLIEKGFHWLGKSLVTFPERAGRWSYALYPIAWVFSVLGQTGRMTVWAKLES